jgi:intraflagellar transport protein 81
MTREHCEVKLPADIAAKRQRLEEVKKLYDLPEVRADDLRNEEDEISRLRQREQQMLDKQKSQMPQGDDKLSMFRQQAALVGSKKEKAQDRHEMLSEDLKALEEDLAEKRKKLGQAGVPRILKGAEFQKYAEGLKIKAKEYKKKKGELSSVVAEKGILSRTEDILKGRHGDQSEFLAKLETQKGISGAAAMQDRCVNVSVL